MPVTPHHYSSVTPADRSGVSVVAPTLREAANIPALARRVSAALSSCGTEWELILVDDNSADGSESVVAELASTIPVRMEVRRDARRDLALSVLLGFRLASFDRLVVLDADLSHPPERIPDLLAALDGTCDMVVGSRYMEGGSVQRAWGAGRFLTSRLATVLALPLSRCSDPMSGFFAVRREALPPPDSLRPIGYKIGLELMVRGHLRVREVPISFAERARGASKLNLRQQVDYLRHLQRLYVHAYGGLARALSFALVGASGMVIDVACYAILQQAGVEHRMARFLSFWPAVSWNWGLNRWFTFGDRPHQPRFPEWGAFVASSIAGLAANVGTYTALTTYLDLFNRHRYLALLCGIGLGSISNFLVVTLYVYRRHTGPVPL